jgi:hypothetical protein
MPRTVPTNEHISFAGLETRPIQRVLSYLIAGTRRLDRFASQRDLNEAQAGRNDGRHTHEGQSVVRESYSHSVQSRVAVVRSSESERDEGSAGEGRRGEEGKGLEPGVT